MPTDLPSPTASPLGSFDQQSRDLLAGAMQAHGLSADGAEELATMMVSASESSNPWLSSSPMPAFLEVFSELVRANQQLRLAEQIERNCQIRQMQAMAEDQATRLREQAQIEAQIHLAQAIAQAAAGMAGVVAAGQLGAVMREKTDSLDRQVSSDMQMTQAMIAQAASVSGIFSVMDSVLELQKGEIDAQNTLLNAMSDSVQKQIGAAKQQADQAADALDDIVSTLNRLMEASNRAMASLTTH